MGDLGYSYRRDKEGQVRILRNGKPVTTLRGKSAVKFLNAVKQGSFDSDQQLMARVTGNYKHGNERAAKRHKRDTRTVRATRSSRPSSD